MRLRHVIGVSLLGTTLLVPAVVLARKDADTAGPTVTLTTVEALDGTLRRAQAIEGTILAATTNLASARAGVLTTLGAAADTPLATALAELRTRADGRIKLTINGSMPSLTSADGMPESARAGLDATNRLLQVGAETVATVAGLGADIQALVAETAAMPATLPSLGLDRRGLRRTRRIVGKNGEAILEFPDRVTALTDEVARIFDDVKTVFGA